ncbi:hypothetical protein A2313_02700 [Candidatus Roizmanbacteria bacterium RIFOXYB2_FULL_41_10]|uniref:DUF2090 domain-containing protein n=1 Tax=Candidatus Roizmanbacteria bacterium RIFOXYA1_FULL_41_12 TaxID=1802082 RepID=A0A1F7KAW4_9BACT|nr:MAG: hypothetical protein A2209_04920 [Candidatus Roizmanbacteria bacterium RIFOXYA1_FULL_41_12]OGK66735.1 MAG: hypothetical protein A2377_02400 [Candidatus Roizmanbacteria bacterium RIFOXYB1_FULL_41_27]OGK70647.1 MAG: hypothetical protein A2313_02700 [Candidatus Roizmanbacteria bacterium RIFOXYB2_FULL_41_10]OGK70891.1 MAG: hypothetical protein A2403_02310 [Candidatus Roizmanbacteria bacterium RIFOXYC1_FULL_41_16]
MSSISDFTLKNKILMLALDHRGSFNKLINPSSPESVTLPQVIDIKKEIIASLYDQFSGILIDSIGGLPAFEKVAVSKAIKKPYLLCIEKTGYEDEQGSRKTQLEYSVENLKNQGASGIKLLLYYHPSAPTKDHQLNIARQVLLDCRRFNLPLFLELVTYSIENYNSHKPELVLDSVYQFLEAGIIPDVFKLEYPGDPVACFQISKLLKKTPWILLTKGDSFANFREQLKIAIRNGAVGFLAGRSLWQEFNQYAENKRLDFFQTVVVQRFAEIAGIVLEA